MTKTQQLISIPFSALFLQVTIIISFSYLSIFSRPESIQSSWSRNSAHLSSAVQVRVLANFLLRAFDHLQSFFEATFFLYSSQNLSFFFLKKIKINKIKSIGKISGKKQYCTEKNHNHQEVGGLLGETLQESSVKELQIVGRQCKSSDLTRFGQIWSGTTINSLQREA